MQNTLVGILNLQIFCTIVLEDHFLASQAVTILTCLSAVAISVSNSFVFMERCDK